MEDRQQNKNKSLGKTNFRCSLIRRSIQSGKFQACEICSRNFDVMDLKAEHIIPPKIAPLTGVVTKYATENGLLLCSICTHLKKELIRDICQQANADSTTNAKAKGNTKPNQPAESANMSRHMLSASARDLLHNSHNPHYQAPLFVKLMQQPGWPTAEILFTAAAYFTHIQERDLTHKQPRAAASVSSAFV